MVKCIRISVCISCQEETDQKYLSFETSHFCLLYMADSSCQQSAFHSLYTLNNAILSRNQILIFRILSCTHLVICYHILQNWSLDVFRMPKPLLMLKLLTFYFRYPLGVFFFRHCNLAYPSESSKYELRGRNFKYHECSWDLYFTNISLYPQAAFYESFHYH